MKKGELIDSVLIRTNGGRITQDSKVKRPDVSVLLAAAINYSITGQFWVNKRATGESDYPADFVTTYENVEVKENTNRDLKYIDLPAGSITLPDDGGLRSVSPMKGADEFYQTKLTDQKHNSYYPVSLGKLTLWWREGQRLYFNNIVTDKVLVRLIQSINDIGDDEEIAIPAGMEIQVMQLLVDWFTGQKQMPADMKPDNNNNL